ncbi:hypothetical protein BJV82DRAFT_640023 [Fennellomyces sp. T-0311]|nr:hypothetical protein BJV82DRAFT_640023 [Fennellomyces sp. T-0311]
MELDQKDQPTDQDQQHRNPRILKDVFHLMNMLKISKRHGLSKEFAREFRDALFVVNTEDKARIERHLQTTGLTWDYMRVKNPAWIQRRCRRTVPQPQSLYSTVQLLFAQYGHMVCAKTGRELFDDEPWRQTEHILAAIRNGEVSDPPGIALYFQTAVDQHNLPLYRCCRGTNSLEGGVHQNIIRKFASFGAGPHMTECMLADYRLRHNIDVGSKNRYGKVHLGHYSPWLTQNIRRLEEQLWLDDQRLNATDLSTTLIVKNALRLRVPTETFGIAPFPAHVAASIAIQKSYHPEILNTRRSDPELPIKLCTNLTIPAGATSNSRGRMYNYIASRLQTLYAVTPVHTNQEFRLFSGLIREDTARDGQPINWIQKAKDWNTYHANGVMREHLQSPEREPVNRSLPANVPAAAEVAESNENSLMFAPVIFERSYQLPATTSVHQAVAPVPSAPAPYPPSTSAFGNMLPYPFPPTQPQNHYNMPPPPSQQQQQQQQIYDNMPYPHSQQQQAFYNIPPPPQQQIYYNMPPQQHEQICHNMPHPPPQQQPQRPVHLHQLLH